jgi:hypothetical protein
VPALLMSIIISLLLIDPVVCHFEPSDNRVLSGQAVLRGGHSWLSWGT